MRVIVPVKSLSRPKAAARKSFALRLVHFGWTSGSGLVVDVCVFTALVHVGASAFRANLVSSSLAITLAYLLVSRFSFRSSPTWRTYSLFVLWYAGSATAVSSVVEVVSHGDSSVAFFAKLTTVPITFTTNFLFGRWLFAGGGERLLLRLGTPRWTVIARLAEETSRRGDVAVAVGVSAWYTILVVPISQRVAFTESEGSMSRLEIAALELLFALLLAALVLFVIRFMRELRAGSLQHRRWLRASALCLAVNLVVFVMIYPGFWVWDEVGILKLVRTYSGLAWQGYLTNAYYTICLFLVPTGVAISVVQIVFVSVVSGYLVSALMGRLRRRLPALLLAVPLLMPTTLLNNQYPLRLTAYAYLVALVLARFILLASSRPHQPASPAALFGFGAAVAVLAFWRTEGLIFLVLIPMYFIIGRFRMMLRFQPVTATFVAAGVVGSIVLSGGLTARHSSPEYETMAYINPLSTMVQQPLHSANLSSDLRAINMVIPLDGLRKFPSHTESPEFWNRGLQPNFAAHLGAMRTAYLDLVMDNPGPFFKNRWEAFLAANSMEPNWLPMVMAAGAYYPVQGFPEFVAGNRLAHPIDVNLRTATIRSLLMAPTPAGTTASTLIWNAAPVLAGLVVLLMIAASRRRRWPWAVCVAVVLGQASLVFLTEPAAYFMYFFPAYLVGGLTLAAAAALALDGVLFGRRAAKSVVLAAQPDVGGTPRELVGA